MLTGSIISAISNAIIFVLLLNNHFDGSVYVLTGGNSFSATCLFAGALKGAIECHPGR